MKHAIISIHPEHVAEIVSGSKTVEIRSRRTSLEKGSRLWIYSTLPVGAIEVMVEVEEVSCVSPMRAWKEFEHVIKVNRSAYRSYVNGSSVISAIRFARVARLREPLSLNTLRKWCKRFHPPQFLKCLDEKDRLYKLLVAKELRRARRTA